MEIYNGEATSVTVKLPTGAGTVKTTIKRDGTIVDGPTDRTVANDYITVPIPYTLTTTDADLILEVTFALTPGGADNLMTLPIRVVTPLLSTDEMKEILPNATDDEIKRVERKVRTVIEATSAQYFGKYKGTLSIYGTGESTLQTTRRIISIDSLSSPAGVLATTGISLVNDGWGVTWPVKGWIEVNSIADGDIYRSGPVITDPRTALYFTKNVLYSVTGTFGYEYVPFDVKEAARALVNDYACQESLYRERYINTISAADWRFAFGPGAFAGTGNIVADQILAGYQRNILAVI